MDFKLNTHGKTVVFSDDVEGKAFMERMRSFADANSATVSHEFGPDDKGGFSVKYSIGKRDSLID